jgi:anti-sigma B factor antagonist
MSDLAGASAPNEEPQGDALHDEDPYLQVTTSCEGHVGVIVVAGDLDVGSRDQLREAAGELLAQGCTHLVIDGSSLDFVDSSGLAAVLDLRRKAVDRGGRLTLRQPSRAVQRTLESTGLEEILPTET